MPLNGCKLIALVPMFGAGQIRYYYAVVDRESDHDRYVVVSVNDPTNNETWNYSVSYHDNLTEAMRALYVTANLHIVGRAIAEEEDRANAKATKAEETFRMMHGREDR